MKNSAFKPAVIKYDTIVLARAADRYVRDSDLRDEDGLCHMFSWRMLVKRERSRLARKIKKEKN